MEYLQLVFWMFLYIGFGLVIGHSMGYREGHKDGYNRGKAVGRHISYRLNANQEWTESTTRTGKAE